MNIFRKWYCRLYQILFRIMLPLLPYREPKLLNNNQEIINLLTSKVILNVMLVTGKKIRELGLTADLEKQIVSSKIKLTVFDRTIENPTTDNVEEAVKEYQQQNCEAIIALGGGSVIDCAKALGARIACPNRTLKQLKGMLRVKNKLPLLIAIPTTAGTGSETTLTAVITDSETHHKYTMNDFDLIPRYAMLDENLTVGLPKFTTAITGMDALTHAIEAYIGRSATSQTRKYALEAIKLIFENLQKAYDDGSNLEARKNMLKASYLAGVAFSKSYVGYVHAIAHTLGGKYGTPHGLAVATILPHMLKDYGKSVYKKLWKIGIYTQLFDEKMDKKQGAEIIIQHIENLNKKMGIGKTIKELKVDDINELVRIAEKEANPLYPVPKLYSAKNLKKIYFCIKN